jgi:putative peptidoglycan lipid II flippase
VLVQLPIVLRLAPDLRFALDTGSAHVRTVVRNFGPVFVSRGVVQLSGYIDTLIASLLPTGAVAALLNAQTIGLLPVSLFGMSVSAAELPAMSGALGVEPQGMAALQRRLDSGLRQIAFFVVPSAMAFLALGDVIAAALFQPAASHTKTPCVGDPGRSAVGLLCPRSAGSIRRPTRACATAHR